MFVIATKNPLQEEKQFLHLCLRVTLNCLWYFYLE